MTGEKDNSQDPVELPVWSIPFGQNQILPTYSTVIDEQGGYNLFCTPSSSSLIYSVEGDVLYQDPAAYTINTQLNVLRDMSETGTLEEQNTKEMLKYISDTQRQLIDSQNELMVKQENLLNSTKEESHKLSKQIDYLQKELLNAEKRLKIAIENKYFLTEMDIVKSIKFNPLEYTSFFSKMGLTITLILLFLYVLFGTSLTDPKILIILVISFTTYLLMAKRGVRSGRK